MQLFKTSLLTMLAIFCSQAMLFSMDEMTKEKALATLGLNKEATENDIKRAYRQQALEWYPDKWATNHPNATDEEKKTASQNFQKYDAAYKFLTKKEDAEEALAKKIQATKDEIQRMRADSKDKDDRLQRGLDFYVEKYAKNADLQRDYPEFINLLKENITNFNSILTHKDFDHDTFITEINALLEAATVNPQAKQEEAERLRREAEEQERQARLRRQEEVRLEKERLDRETERIRREREERQRKAEEARLKAEQEQERLRRQEEADERAWREAQRRQEQEAEEQRKEQEVEHRQEEARLEAERLHQEQDRIRREAEEADHIREEAEEAERQHQANSPQTKELVTQALELATQLL